MERERITDIADPDGRRIEISRGIADDGKFMAFHRKANGSLRRVRGVPDFNTIEEVYSVLFDYAREHARKQGWHRVCDQCGELIMGWKIECPRCFCGDQDE